MARKSKCKSCGELIESDMLKKHKGKSYCDQCYDTVSNNDEEEVSNYKLLIETICKYFNISKPTGLIMKQVKEYKDTYGYSDGGIGYTLWYVKEIEGKRFDDVKYGIAIVKYYYEKAEAYFMQQSRVRDSMKDHVPEENTKVVKVNRNNTQKNNRNSFTIDIDALLERDGDG